MCILNLESDITTQLCKTHQSKQKKINYFIKQIVEQKHIIHLNFKCFK